MMLALFLVLLLGCCAQLYALPQETPPAAAEVAPIVTGDPWALFNTTTAPPTTTATPTDDYNRDRPSTPDSLPLEEGAYKAQPNGANGGDVSSEQPIWHPCPQKSTTSYLNLTFQPYPLKRGKMVRVGLNGYLDEDIPEGTMLEMRSYVKGFSLVPGPKFKLDICKYIAERFPNSPNTIQCPLNQWAIKLVLYALQQQQQELDAKDPPAKDAAATTTSKASENSLEVRIPKLVFPASYRTQITLVTGQGTVLTCAETVIKVQ